MSTGLLALRLRSGDARLRGVDGIGRADPRRGSASSRRHLQIERGQGSLSVRVGASDGFDLGTHDGTHGEDLVIDVPTRATVVVEASSADVTIDGLTGDQRFRTPRATSASGTSAGRSRSRPCPATSTCSPSIAPRSPARTVSGDLAVRASDLESLRVTTTSGDVRLAGRLAGAGPFAIETVSGDMLLALAGGVRLEASTVAGDVTSEVTARSEGSPGRRVLDRRRGTSDDDRPLDVRRRHA